MGFERVLAGLFLALLAGCTSYESAYERRVYDYEPVYCYQSLGAVSCYREPRPRDARRLVNYYGPAPSKYPQPEPAEEREPQPPPKTDRYSVAPEPDPANLDRTVGATSHDDTSSWTRYLPILTVLFGVAQVAAAFLL